MAVTRVVARPMLAAMFVSGGLDQLKRPHSKVMQAEKVAEPIAEKLHLPADDPATLIRLNGAVQVGAASLLALGKLPRLSAAALAASLVPTTLAGHRFWEEYEPGRRTTQRIMFLKNLSMLGGLVLAATDTEGRPSLSWKARTATADASRKIGHRSRRASRQLSKAIHQMEKAAETTAHKVEQAAENGAHSVAAALPVGHH